MASDEIKAELAKLKNTTAFVTPTNFLQPDKFSREGVAGPGREPKKPLSCKPDDIKYLIERGEKLLPLDHDPDVTRLVAAVTFSERQKAPAEPTLETFLKKQKPKKAPRKHTKSQVGALQRMDAGPMRTMNQDAFEFSEDMKQELRGRDTSFTMKRDTTKTYTEELVKWQTMEKLMK